VSKTSIDVESPKLHHIFTGCIRNNGLIFVWITFIDLIHQKLKYKILIFYMNQCAFKTKSIKSTGLKF